MGAKTIVHPTPVFVVGTYDKEGKPNVMTAAWGGICCSVPPCLSVSLREATYTYHNILERQAFTVSIPSAEYVKEADFFGITSGKDLDKFQATGLTPQKSEVVDAPYVDEFPFVLECKLLQSLKIGLHTQFIGEIIDIKVEEDVHKSDSLLQKIKPLIYSPDDSAYYRVGNFVAKAFSVGKQVKK
jgi:flavin reductase (DIM6/NTAB) family NADH-FMN oxidoreductase RutF